MNKLFTFISLLVASLITPAAVMASTLSLNPSTGTFNKGCGFSLNIQLDTQGVDTDGTDVYLNYDPTKMTATTISKGSIYPDYPETTIDSAAGRVSISGLASVSQAFNGQGTFATINFQVPSTASNGQTAINFDFDPNNKAKTTDSNVVQRGTVLDTLTAVTNGTYTIGSDACSTNSTPAPTTNPGTSTGSTGTTGTTTTVIPGRGATTVFSPTTSTQTGILKTPTTVTTLPDSALSGPTVAIALVGTVLTVIGIIGFMLL